MRDFTPEPFWEQRQHKNNNNTGDFRSQYERDRARLIHAPSFRRMQSKTQVLSISETDYHRTRLTHTMEVAQIGRGLVHKLEVKSREQYDGMYNQILPCPDLIEALAFGHDLGHPPFGHNGEIALNYMMRNHGGFEGNGQSLRLVTKLEKHPEYIGHDLTRRTLLGILKYLAPYSKALCPTRFPEAKSLVHVSQQTWHPPKCYLDSEQDVVNWVLAPLDSSDVATLTGTWKEPPANAVWEKGQWKPQHGETLYKSLDCSILELADDIAYGTHDLEDGIAVGLITENDWQEVWATVDRDWFFRKIAQPNETHEDMTANLFPKGAGTRGPSRRHAVNELIGAFIYSVDMKPQNVFQSPLLDLRAFIEPPAKDFLNQLKKLTFRKVIRSAEVQTLDFRGRMMVSQVFDAICSDPYALLKQAQLAEYDKATTEEERMRVICDYVSGMTDPYASRFFERLYVPRAGSTFDKL